MLKQVVWFGALLVVLFVFVLAIFFGDSKLAKKFKEPMTEKNAVWQLVVCAVFYSSMAILLIPAI